MLYEIVFILINTLTNTTIMPHTSINEDYTSENLALHYLVRQPTVKTSTHKAIILLHGVGSNEQDLFSLADQLPGDYYIVAARGQYTLGPGRYAWYNVDFSTGKPVINAGQELSSRELLKQFIGQLKQKYSLDEVYIGGFSQGAIMSYSIGLTSPEQVRGIMALSGRVLETIQASVTGNNRLSRLKVFVAHGTQDGTLPVFYAQQAKTFLQTLNVSLTYHEYTMGHQINADVLEDLVAWLKKD
ncbi:alpha/beta hydrolase [Ohtaekwangia kribbensis]|jgi:phospholipase/carboxylesterase|uniref:Alpha/beta hydrolase n=1 Tax=Ohtaekwangia kribbensis TaxID=688913 RepID=A0ABW3K5P5_9BACT